MLTAGGLILLTLSIAACRPIPSAGQPAASSTDLTLAVTALPLEMDSVPSPTPTASAATPVATAALLRAVRWSPDSRWLAYLETDQAQLDQAIGAPPESTWVLYDATTGRSCTRPEIGVEWQLAWEPPATLHLTTPEGVRRSEPCGPLGPLSPSSGSATNQAAAGSPGGEFTAQTERLSADSGVLRLRTTLTNLARGTIVAQAAWTIDERLGDMGLGGEWVGPSTFLLSETLQQGPLLIETSGAVRPVLPDLFGLDSVPSILGPDAYGWVARPSIDWDAGVFHLLLSGVGEEAGFPPALLYHSQDASVETLPYRYPWRGGFTPDGRWLLMDARPEDAGYEAHQVWTRPLENREDDWLLLADRVDGDAWAPDMTSYAWLDGSRVSWRTFPEAQALGEWDADPYAAHPALISADGCRLAAEGNIPGTWDAGLFIWDRCTGGP